MAHPLERRMLLRAAFALSVLAFALWRGVTGYASVIAAGGGPYQTADWLINYGGGFVRRGLLGELLLAVAPPGQATLWVLFGVQNLCYVPLVLVGVRHLARCRYSWSAIAVVCSPATVTLMGWDAMGGYRKEIIGFAALCLLLLARPVRHRAGRWALWAAALLVMVVGVLSWEPTVVMLPAAAYLLAHGRPRTPEVLGVLAAFAVLCGAGLLAAVTHQGGPDAVEGIVAALRAHGVEGEQLFRRSAITDIASSLREQQHMLGSAAQVNAPYLMWAVLAAMPLVLSRWFLRHVWWGLAVIGATVPLYVIALDWGRWEHVAATALSLCVMSSHPDDSTARVWRATTAIPYVTLWGVPHIAPGYWPWIGALPSVLSMLPHSA